MTPGSRRAPALGVALGVALIAVGAMSSCGYPDRHPPPAIDTVGGPADTRTHATCPAPIVVAPDGQPAPIADLVNAAITTARRLPGAVAVKIAHAGNVVVHKAFGWRKLDGELESTDHLPSPSP